MLNETLTLIFNVLSLLSQSLPCSTPVSLAAGNLTTQKYMGKWYFIAAVSHREADIQMFRPMDSTVFMAEESVKGTLLLTGGIHIGDKCHNATWTYHIHPGRDDMELEGSPLRRTLVWSGEWLNCSQCIILQEIEPPRNEKESEDALSRFMLYARQSDVDPEVVKTFQKESACLGMDAFVRLPQQKGFCCFLEHFLELYLLVMHCLGPTMILGEFFTNVYCSSLLCNSERN